MNYIKNIENLKGKRNMKNLELIKNKQGGYGIKDLDSNQVVIPCMYEIKELNFIVEIQLIENGLYLLKGLKDGKEVFGLYNDYQNELIEVKYQNIEVKYPNIEVIDENIILFDGESRIAYNSMKSETNEPVRKGIRINFHDDAYGIENENGKIIIPCRFTREELMNIGSVEEVLPNIYVLFDIVKGKKPVGFYDSENGKFVHDTFESYEIISGTLVLRREVIVDSKSQGACNDIIRSKSYISIYHPKYKRYIKGEKYYDQIRDEYQGTASYTWHTPMLDVGLEEHDGVILLGSGRWKNEGNAIYDTTTDFFKEDVMGKCYDSKQVELYQDELFLGYYNLETRSIEEYVEIENVFLDDEKRKLYISSDEIKKCVYKYWDDKMIPVEQFTDFNILFLEYSIIIFDKKYNMIAEISRKNLKTITEIRPKVAEVLGVPMENGKTVYLVNGELCYFKKSKMKKIEDNKSKLPFVKLPQKLVASTMYEYGIGVVEASSETELDYILEQIDNEKEQISKKMETMFYEDEELQQEYPTLVKRK